MTNNELPPGWVRMAARDLFTLVTSGSRGWAKYYADQGPLFIRVGNLDHNTIRLDLNGVQHVRPPEGAEGNRTQLRPNDILISITAELGMVGLVPEDLPEAYINQHVALARPVGDVDARFLAWFFATEGKVQLERLRRGATKAGLGLDDIRSVDVSMPPLNEQRRIVDKIEALTERSRRAKEALDAIPPLLERFRQSVLAAAFRGDLTADWRAKNPDVESADKLLERIRAERRRRWEEDYLAGQRAKGKEPTNDKWKAKYVEPEPVDTEGLPELPASWSWARLEELTPPEAPVVYGIVQPGPHVPGGVPYVRPADITEGRVDPHALLRTSAAIAGKHGRATLGVGDLVYSIVGTIGKHLIVDASLEGANITQSAVRIRPMAPLSAPQILWTLGCAPVQAQMKRLAFGNAVQRLNVAHMRELVVPVLPAAEWTVLEPLIEAADKCVAMQRGATVRSAEQLALLERAILAKAFRGALVPQDPNDDVQGIAEGTTRRARRRAP
ncbi:MAG: restriction endonuclease subunit S [Sandaracinaceae bacterium]|nr:restriction endonuclease subunit S [Sandaracinaceae bacterium]